MVEVPAVCRGVIVVRRTAIILIVLKMIRRDVVTSVEMELVPYQNATLKSRHLR